ncbi:MAG: nucleotide exchange factor GrpE [Pseudomonadota bacterium]
MQDKEPQNSQSGGIESTSPVTQTTAANDPASEAEAETNFAVDLEKQLSDALSEAGKLKDALLRAAADSDNMRKRAQTDISNAHKFALENFSNALLPVKDSLEAALGIENATVESYKNGVDLTLKQLDNVLSKFNITEINPVGEKFDPHRHQAMAMVDSEQNANTVVAVMQKGYSLNDRVLRPALVTVAKPKTDA